MALDFTDETLVEGDTYDFITKMNNMMDKIETHAHGELYYTETETDGFLSAKADTSHTQAISTVTGLQTALDGKIDDSQVLTNVPAGALFTDTNTQNTINNTLTSTSTTESLSANMGKSLNDNKLPKTNPVITGSITEDIYAIPTSTAPALEPENGTIQTWTLSANSTPTDSIGAGEYMTLMIIDGTAYTITWPTITWIGGVAPVLSTSGTTVLELWKVGTSLYGSEVGVL